MQVASARCKSHQPDASRISQMQVASARCKSHQADASQKSHIWLMRVASGVYGILLVDPDPTVVPTFPTPNTTFVPSTPAPAHFPPICHGSVSVGSVPVAWQMPQSSACRTASVAMVPAPILPPIQQTTHRDGASMPSLIHGSVIGDRVPSPPPPLSDENDNLEDW